MQWLPGWALPVPYNMTPSRPWWRCQKQMSWGCPTSSSGPCSHWHSGVWQGFATELQIWQFHRYRPVPFTDKSRFTLSTCGKTWNGLEKLWRTLYSVTLFSMSDLGRDIHGVTHRPIQDGQWHSDCQSFSEPTLSQWVLDSSWCTTMPDLMQP